MDPTWDETWRLVGVLAADPSAQITGSLNGWRHPLSHEGLLLADVFDSLEAARVGRKAQPHPRPFDRKPTTLGGGSRLTQDRIRAHLAAIGPSKEATPDEE